MFVREAEPIPLTRDGLEALCVSLNRPVVEIAELPVGPARAVIALHRSDAGEACLAVALRSIDAGVVEVFRFEGELHDSVERAMDVGLSFAESLGFLFDEDMIGGAKGDDGFDLLDEAAGSPRERGAERAHALWCELVGEAPPEADPDADPAVGLSKFRTRLSAGGDASADSAVPEPEVHDPNADSQSAQLGRIPIVRRRRSDDASPAHDLVTRLLASF